MTKKDLTGLRFGKLTVLREVEPYVSPAGVKTRRWLCRCDCGTELSVLQNALTATKNGTRSCGCSRREQLMVDMVGQRFGRLVVLRPAPLPRKQASGQVTGWLCQCDCGKQIVATRKELLSGKLQSCGCSRREASRRRLVDDNVTGRYDRTVVSTISPDRKPNSNNKSGYKGVYWLASEQVWVASIGLRGKEIKLGRFRRIEDAVAARKAAEEELYAPIIESYNQSKDK